MPVTMSKFTCSNGHSFEANAKLRARCPECGVMTRRNFSEKQVVTPPVESPPPKEDKEGDAKVESPKSEAPKKTAVLIRQGRPRVMKQTPAKTSPAPKKLSTRASSGLVKSTKVKTKGVIPVIKRRPVKTAVARGIKGHEVKRKYWEEVAEKYGF